MAWPNPFRATRPNERDAWGYRFEFTKDHLTPDQYEPLKHSYDTRGEEVLNRLNEISPPSAELPRNNSRHSQKPGDKDADPKVAPRDLYAILRDHAETDELLGRFWRDVTTVPDWVDWDQIARGQDVFYRYGGANLTGLAYQSLLGGMGAARVVETLARTGGFSTKVARGRLFETTQHILQCTKSLESIQPGGEGFASTIRVRLLHAAVRNRILKLAESRPDYYNLKEWGVPINDLDSIATIDTFSASLVWLSLPRQGIFLREQEIVDYIALWRYIAHVIGAPTEGFFENSTQAKRIFESLLYFEIEPSATSQVLANNIIKCLQDQPPGYASADLLIAGARWLNGNKLGDALGLPRPSLYYWFLMAGQCIFFCFWCYIYRAIPSWDRKKIEMLRKIFWSITVESKYGLKGEMTNFDFKYVPEYSTITEMGDSPGAQLKYNGVEGRNLKTAIIATGIFGVSMWCTFKAGLGITTTIVSNIINDKMQRAQRCRCAVKSVEVFVREFAGLEIQSRFIRPQLFRQLRKPSSNVRLFGTTSAFGIQRSSLNANATSTAQSVSDALDAVSAPLEQNSKAPEISSHNATEDQKLDILEPAKSRVENRQERRARRDKARKAQFEEVKRQEKEARKLAAAKEKQERRREARKIAATSQAAPPSPSPSTEATDEPTAAAPVYKQRARLARRAAARWAAANPGSDPAPAPSSVPSSAPSETRDMGKNAKKKAKRAVAAPSSEPAQTSTRQTVRTPSPSVVPSTRKSSETPEKQTRREEKKSKRTKARVELVKPAPSQEADELVGKEMTKTEREAWMIQKAALQEKFGEQQWNPRKRISPDALAGIRSMHAAQPGVYSTEVLAHHFKVSPEAIRRILKSKWQPDEEASEDRRRRWEKRGEKKWKEMVEQGIRPPKKWREMGVGSVGKGETPTWKKGSGKGGERWIEQAETDSFVMAGDMAAERGSDGASIGDRIV